MMFFHSTPKGYFTSRTAFKKLERVASSFLLAARQIESLPENVSDVYIQECQSRCDCDKPLYELEDALGVVQHHDAVSGTAKQHVSNDYSKRVQAGINKASQYVAMKLKRLLANDAKALEALDNLSFCQLINETICEVSQVRP
jgi:alpha-mannosidase